MGGRGVIFLIIILPSKMQPSKSNSGPDSVFREHAVS